MLPSQKLALRASEIRTKLAALAGADGELSDEAKGEIATLRNEYQDVEVRYQATATAEDVKKTETAETAEGAEYRALVDKAELGSIYAAALEHRNTDGAEAELQSHLEIGPNQIPLDLLRFEERAVTPAPTNTSATEQPVVAAVFANSVGAFLGVDQPTVGAGDAVYPVITSRATVAGPFSLSEEAAETTGAFDAELLKPERLQASFFYKRTDSARFRGMSSALRDNLSMALGDALDKEIVSGTDGLLAGTNLDNNNVSAITSYDLFLAQFGFGRVDGRYAGSVSDLRSVMGAGSYARAGAVYRGNASDRTAASELDRLTAGVRVSAHVPDASSSKQNNVVRLGMRRDMVSPIWEGVTLIPDEITQAKKGEIVITAILMHAVKLLRSEGFYKQQVQTA